MNKHKRENNWNNIYNLACNYYNFYKDLEVSASFKTLDGITYSDDENAIKLGNWIRNQRMFYKKNKLSQEKIILLEKIGMKWIIYDKFKQNKKIELAKKYYNHYGHLNVPNNFRTKDGINYSNEKHAVKLGHWLYINKSKYEKNLLSDLQKDQLKDLVPLWAKMKNSNYKWDYIYNLACNYYNFYSDLNIKRSFKTVDGINPSNDEDAINLGIWIATQREYYKLGRLSQEKIDLLNKIGMIWSFDLKKEYEDIWNEKYNLVKNYYNHYGNLSIPIDFKTFDGINPSNDEDAIKLGIWLFIQKRNRTLNKLSQERIDLLNDLNISWPNHFNENNLWNKNYMLLCNYYNHYKNINIPYKFKTVDGINKSNNDVGIYLDDWVRNQRTKYKNKKLTKDQIELLNKINFVFMENRTKQKNILNLLRLHNIKLELNNYNSLIIDRITYHEFYVKLLFLKENNIYVLDDNGNLNNIFNISNEYLEKIYNVTLEQLLNKYFYFNKINKNRGFLYE